jgi:hypothetical protein
MSSQISPSSSAIRNPGYRAVATISRARGQHAARSRPCSSRHSRLSPYARSSDLGVAATRPPLGGGGRGLSFPVLFC